VLRWHHGGVANSAQAVRPSGVSRRGGSDSQGASAAGRHGSVARTPQGEFAFGYGSTELGVTSPPRADTHFRVASNTKTMTAAAIVLLVQEGQLRFDDPVSKYIQGVPNGDNITIQRAPQDAERPVQLHVSAGTRGRPRP